MRIEGCFSVELIEFFGCCTEFVANFMSLDKSFTTNNLSGFCIVSIFSMMPTYLSGKAGICMLWVVLCLSHKQVLVRRGMGQPFGQVELT